MNKVLSGKEVSESITKKLIEEAEACKKDGIIPCLAILRVGTNSQDIAYEKGLMKKAEQIGIKIKQVVFDDNIKEDELINTITDLNNNPDVHAVLMFRPLPKHLDEDKVRNALDPAKDVDCITDESLHNIFIDGNNGFPSCTAEAAIAILDYYGYKLEGKKVVVLGRSLVIGKPVAMLLLKSNATVTLCHSKTNPDDLIFYCKNADIIISAVGRMNTITKDHVSGNQTVIDVGINFDENGKMCGDVDFDEVKEFVQGISPVPGGVGTVTTTILFKHLLQNTRSN